MRSAKDRIRDLKGRINGNTTAQEFFQNQINIMEREKIRLKKKIAAIMAEELCARGMQRSPPPKA